MKILRSGLMITTMLLGSLSANADRLFDFFNSYLQKDKDEILESLSYLERAGLSKGPFKKEDFLRYITASFLLNHRVVTQQAQQFINNGVDYYLEEIGSKEDLKELLGAFVGSLDTQFTSLRQHHFQNAIAGNLPASEREAAAEKAVALAKISASVIERLRTTIETSLENYQFRKKIKLFLEDKKDKPLFSF